MFNKLIAPLLFISLITPASYAQNDVIQIKSEYDMIQTLSRFKEILAKKGMNIFAEIDHQAGASSVGLKIHPTTLLIFGNPEIGTKLIQCQQTIGLDLPLKVLFSVDEHHQTLLSYTDPQAIARKHKTQCTPVVRKMQGAMKKFAEYATSKQ